MAGKYLWELEASHSMETQAKRNEKSITMIIQKQNRNLDITHNITQLSTYDITNFPF